MAEAQRDEIAKLEALYAANPEGRVFTHLAEAYRKAGELQRAQEILDHGLARHPDSATGFVVLGRVTHDRGALEESRSAFRRALELDEGNLVAHRYLAELALSAGDRPEALRHFQELLSRNPGDESLHRTVQELSAATPPPQEPEAPELATPLPLLEAPAAEPEAAAPPAWESPEVGAVADEIVLEDYAGTGWEATAPAAEDGASFAEPEASPTAEWAAESSEAEPEAVAGAGWWEQPPVESGGGAEPAGEWTAEPPSEPPADVEPGLEWSSEPPIDAESEIEPATDWSVEPVSGIEPADEPEWLAEPAGTSAEPWSWAEPEPFAGGAEEPWPAPELLEPLPEVEPGEELSSLDFLAPLPESETEDEDYLEDFTGLESVSFEAEEIIEEAADLGSLDLGVQEPDTAEFAGTEYLDTSLVTPFFEPFADYAEAEPPSTGLDVGEVLPEPPLPAWPEEPAEEAPGYGDSLAAPDFALEPAGEIAGAPDVVTETMAELYRSQGFQDRAAEVYRSLLERDPADERLRAKLRELDAELAAGREAVAGQGAAEEEARDAWMQGVESAFTGGAGAAEGATTPYAWDAAGDEPAATGPAIGDYFRSLLAWRPGAEPEAPAKPEAPADEGAWQPEPAPWQLEPDESWRPDEPPETDAAALETPPAPTPDTMEPAEIVPDLVLEDSPPEPEPFAWTPDMLDEPIPSAPPASPAGPPDLMPWEVAEPIETAAPAEPAEPPPPAPAPEAEPVEEDEDLEMFRSWLQSLKK
jgi:tetratricopeptide (TPR) repeat protein